MQSNASIFCLLPVSFIRIISAKTKGAAPTAFCGNTARLFAQILRATPPFPRNRKTGANSCCSATQKPGIRRFCIRCRRKYASGNFRKHPAGLLLPRKCPFLPLRKNQKRRSKTKNVFAALRSGYCRSRIFSVLYIPLSYRTVSGISRQKLSP